MEGWSRELSIEQNPTYTRNALRVSFPPSQPGDFTLKARGFHFESGSTRIEGGFTMIPIGSGVRSAGVIYASPLLTCSVCGLSRAMNLRYNMKVPPTMTSTSEMMQASATHLRKEERRVRGVQAVSKVQGGSGCSGGPGSDSQCNSSLLHSLSAAHLPPPAAPTYPVTVTVLPSLE